jgi:hypothetical protein
MNTKLSHPNYEEPSSFLVAFAAALVIVGNTYHEHASLVGLSRDLERSSASFTLTPRVMRTEERVVGILGNAVSLV